MIHNLNWSRCAASCFRNSSTSPMSNFFRPGGPGTKLSEKNLIFWAVIPKCHNLISLKAVAEMRSFAYNVFEGFHMILCSRPPHTFWPRCRRSLCKVCPYTLIANSRVHPGAILHRPGWAGLGQTWSLKSGQPRNWCLFRTKIFTFGKIQCAHGRHTLFGQGVEGLCVRYALTPLLQIQEYIRSF